MRPFKQIRPLLAGLGAKGGKGENKFPTRLPFSGAGKFPLSAQPMPYAKFLTHKLSIKGHRVAFMRVFFFFWRKACSMQYK